MDRRISHPGEVPTDVMLLEPQRYTQIALGYMAEAVFGLGPRVYELNCLPTTPPSLQVILDRGMISQLSTVDATAFGSLAADGAPLMKMGVNETGQLLTLSAPSTTGQSQNYLIQVQMQESDADPVALPYFNAANPAVGWSGPSNTGTPQMTHRIQRAAIQVVPGAPAPAGSQTTPGVTAGWVPLWVVTVSAGQTAITSASIVQHPNAPLIPYRLPDLYPYTPPPVVSAMPILTTATVQAPSWANNVHVRLWGAGAGGGGSSGSSSGGSAAGAGEYREAILPVTGGQSYLVTVGNGGPGGNTSPTGGGNGGVSSFGSLLTAAGGTGGGGGSNGVQQTGGAGGTNGSGGPVNGTVVVAGNGGGLASVVTSVGPILQATGGAAFCGAPGSPGVNPTGNPGNFPGGGGNGGLNGGAGGQGANGYAIIRWLG